MHEAGIAASIIDIAENVAGRRDILKIHLRLGAFTGVDRDALDFSFEALKSDTLAAAAQLEIERVPLTAACPTCGWSGEPEEDYCLLCPRCVSPVAIVTGREMQVEWVELSEVTDGTNTSRDQSPERQRPVCRH